MKKLKKLVLKKETISVLNDFSLSRIKGGGDDSWDWFNRYLTGTLSHFDIANCINGYGGSNNSFCYCTNNDQTCQTCDQDTCGATCGGTCENTCFTCNGHNTCQNCA